MSEKEKQLSNSLLEKFKRLPERGKNALCAFCDGMLAAQELMAKSEEKDSSKVEE